MAKPKVANWVAENTTTVGTGTIVLSGPLEGFAPFSVIPNGKVYYTLQSGANKECGIGTLNNGTITRDTIFASFIDGQYATPGARVNLDGYSEVYCTLNAKAFEEIMDAVEKVGGIQDGANVNPPEASLAEATELQVSELRSWSPSLIAIAIAAKAVDQGLRTLLGSTNGASSIKTTSGNTIQQELDALNDIHTLLENAINELHRPYLVSNVNISTLSFTLNFPAENYSVNEPIVIATVINGVTNVNIQGNQQQIPGLGEVYTSVTLTFPDASYIGKRCNVWLVGG